VRIPQDPNWPPEWARRAIFYHIYPLGFLDAPQHNDRQSDPVPRLAELRKWYDHLHQLGVTAVYFGPVFESHSHGYDTINYFSIDRRLGSNELFGEIVVELHDRDIRVILDGVFHHTGRDFFAFRDIREKGRDSDYLNWYYLNWGADSRYGDGFAYDCWEGHQSLPRLNLDNPDTRNYIFEVAKMWLGDVEVDGWRLDVAYEIGSNFWWEFRRECKNINPDCFLLAELSGGDFRTWVAPDLLDSGTNYPLYHAVYQALNKGNFWELKSVMDRAKHAEFGVYNTITLFNFISNHDVTRILSQLDNPRHFYPALIFLMTAPGIPCIYYGDEVGMRGKKEDGDEALRKPMPLPDSDWPDVERHIYRETSRLAAIRRAHPSLTNGRYASLDGGRRVFCFLRQHVREKAVVVLNSADEKTPVTMNVGREGIPDGTLFRDVLDPRNPTFAVHDGKLSIDAVWPGWGRILIADM
jgi:cyclomaltodextrinase